MSRRLDILRRAERLATDLTGGAPAVKKSTFQAVVSDFMHRPDSQRLHRALELLQGGSGGHALRGEGFGEQIRSICDQLLGLIDEAGWSPAELKSLFGWTARCLLIRSEVFPRGRERREAREASPDRAGDRQDPRKPQPGARLAASALLDSLIDDRPRSSPAPARPPKKVSAVVTRVEGANRYVLRIEEPFEAEVSLQAGGLGWQVGERKKVRVVSTDASGRITKVAP